jgi:flagellar assembly protein FliH
VPELDRTARRIEAHRARPFLESTGSDPIAEARACGFAEGVAEGRRQARAELEAVYEAALERLAASLAAVAGVEEALARRHEQRLLEVAVEAASRIVRERIEAGDPVACRALEEAIAALPAPAGWRARLNPSDLETVARELSGEIGRGRIELVPDPGVSRGGVVLESAVGTVDATVETAIASVRRAALGVPEQP